MWSRRIFVTVFSSLLIVAQLLPAQEPIGMGGGFLGTIGGGPLDLLKIEAVLKELKVTEDQARRISELDQGERDALREMLERTRSPDMDREAQAAGFRAYLQKRNETAWESLPGVLQPDQMKRLREIYLQKQGASALFEDTVADELKLTEAQRKRLVEMQTEVRDRMRAQMRELFGNPDRSGVYRKLDASREEAGQRFIAVLTETQREQFNNMKGRPFKLAEQRFPNRRQMPPRPQP